MANLQGFWSYVHKDDQADGERITRLARDVVSQFEMLTGETISLFLDKNEIEWGDNWQDKIDTSLSTVAFFIPVITPRYFMSPMCRHEFKIFTRRATELGVRDLILPILYVDYPPLNDENCEDDLVEIVRSFQWEDWRGLRFYEVTSQEYRQGVSKLATRLVEANFRAEKPAVISQVEENSPKDSNEELGIIDKLAIYEDMMAKLPGTLNSISQHITRIGEIMSEGTNQINTGKSQGKGFSARLIVINRTGNLLREPTDQIWSLCNDYASQLHDIDTGIRIIIDRAPSEIMDDENSKEAFCDFFASIKILSDASLTAIESTQKMLDASETLGKLSRDIRPVIRKQNQGLTILIESAEIFKHWLYLIEKSGVICN